MKHWRATELLGTTADGRYRRIVVQEPRLRSGTLSFAPRDRVEEHAHPDSDEIFYVVSGRGRITVEGEAVDVEAGDLLYVAAGERHALVVDDDASAPLVVLACVAPNHGDDAIFSAERPPTSAT